MKKLLLLAMGWMILSSCAKNVETPNTLTADDSALSKLKGPAAPADITVTSAPATRAVAMVDHIDDLGWALNIKGESKVPDNLPQEFMKNGLQVIVVYTDITTSTQGTTGKGNLAQIHIVHIETLSPTN